MSETRAGPAFPPSAQAGAGGIGGGGAGGRNRGLCGACSCKYLLMEYLPMLVEPLSDQSMESAMKMI